MTILSAEIGRNRQKNKGNDGDETRRKEGENC